MPHQSYIGEDGKEWPSATELTALLPKEWLWCWYQRSVQKDGWNGWLKCRAQSEAGKKIGTAVHGHLETWTSGKEPVEEVENSLALAQCIHDAVNPTVEEYVAIEPHLIHKGLRFHGTADMVYRKIYTPGLRIGDYKTSFEKDISHPIQLTCYAMAWNEEHEDQQIDAGDIFRIDKKTGRVKIDNYDGLKRYYPVVLSLRKLWGYVHEKE